MQSIVLFLLSLCLIFSSHAYSAEGDVPNTSSSQFFSRFPFEELQFNPLNGENLLKNVIFSFEMDSHFLSSEFEKTHYGSFKGYMTTYHEFNSQLDIYVSGVFQFTRGLYQYFSPLNKKVNSGFYLDDMYLSWKDKKGIFSFKMGVLNQGYLDAPTLISDVSFIGLRQEMTMNPKLRLPFLTINNVRLSLQQTIPSGQIELNRFSLVKDISGFMTGSVFFDGQLKLERISQIGRNIDFNTSFTIFGFKDLPADAAIIGRIYNNAVSDLYTGADSEFKYPFFGIHSKISFKTPVFSNLDLEIRTSFLWNTGVLTESFFNPNPKYKGLDKAQTFYLGLHVQTRSHFTVIPNVEYFVNQPNASPAKYNASRYAHSNSKGFIFGVKALLHRYQLAAKLDYAVIENIVQVQQNSNTNYIHFSIGTDYEI